MSTATALEQQVSVHLERAYDFERLARKSGEIGRSESVAGALGIAAAVHAEALDYAEASRRACEVAKQSAEVEAAHYAAVRRKIDDALIAAREANAMHAGVATHEVIIELSQLIALVDRVAVDAVSDRRAA